MVTKTAMKDPEEVVEMRKALDEFRGIVHEAREFQNGRPRPHLVLASFNPRSGDIREDETTKKIVAIR